MLGRLVLRFILNFFYFYFAHPSCIIRERRRWPTIIFLRSIEWHWLRPCRTTSFSRYAANYSSTIQMCFSCGSVTSVLDFALSFSNLAPSFVSIQKSLVVMVKIWEWYLKVLVCLNMNIILFFWLFQIPFLSHVSNRLRAGFAAEVCLL